MFRHLITSLFLIFIICIFTTNLSCSKKTPVIDTSTKVNSEIVKTEVTKKDIPPSTLSTNKNESINTNTNKSKNKAKTDPKSDIFNKYGVKVSGPYYLDIKQANLELNNGLYTAQITLYGIPPLLILDPSVFIEWAVIIETSPDYGIIDKLLYNDIRPDYIVRMNLTDSTRFSGGMIDLKYSKWSPINYFNFNNEVITLSFLPDLINNCKSFKYVVLVRQLGLKGDTQELIFADKAPNSKYFTFP